MFKIDVKHTTAEHVFFVAENMRQADRDEVRMARDVSPLQSLQSSVGITNSPYTAIINDKPAAIFGVSALTVLGSTGVPWLLGTAEMQRIKYPFAKGARRIFSAWGDSFDVLVNYVHAENELSIRLIEWLGCKLYDAEPMGPYKALFRRFEWRKENV